MRGHSGLGGTVLLWWWSHKCKHWSAFRDCVLYRGILVLINCNSTNLIKNIGSEENSFVISFDFMTSLQQKIK